MAALAFLGGKAIFSVDNKIEDLKGDAIELSTITHEAGLPLTSGLLIDLGKGDFSGAVKNGREILRVLRDPQLRDATFQTFLKVQLDKQLADNNKRDALVKYVEDKLGGKLTFVKSEEVEDGSPA